ncbi:MAG TPA: hypothetical protein PKZ25_00665, partial [Candidatus Hydrogenedentes bacterium]|nr:hypothetical protein [Candidatus Hydrogenedentota bacterium]
VTAVNRCVKRLLERLYNFELALMWGSARAAVHMRSHRTADIVREAEARRREIENALLLRDAGFISHERAAESLGIKAS